MVIKDGVTVAYGDLIQINGRYNSAGSIEVITDTNGATSSGTPTIFTSAGHDFSAEGVAVNDILWIKEGVDEGFYKITTVGTTTVSCSAASFGTDTVLDYEIWTSIIFKGRITDRNFEKVKTVLCESEAEEIDKQIENDFYCGRLGGLVQELLDNECAFINHNFTQSSPYNYRAPHNFRNDTVGTSPDGWSSTGTGVNDILASVGDHKMVARVNNSGTGMFSYRALGHNNNVGTYEGYINTDTASKRLYAAMSYDSSYNISDPFYGFEGIILRLHSDGNMYVNNGQAWVNIRAYSLSTWYLFRIVYDNANHTYDIYINDILEASGYSYTDNLDVNYMMFHARDISSTLYFDAIGDTGYGDYIQGVNATKEYDQLIYTTEFKKYPMTEKTMRLYFNSYADKHLKVWYITPDYEILFNDGDVDSGIEIGASSNVKNIDGQKQVKAIDKVHLKGGIVNGVRLFSTYGSGDVIAKDTYSHILDQADLDDLAQQVFTRQSIGIIKVALDFQELIYGYTQIGEEITIVGNTLRFQRSEEYIATVDTQFKLRGERLQLGENAVIIYSELYLDDVLLFRRSEQEETRKATEENSQLISEVTAPSVIGAGGGEVNTMLNVGAGGVGVYKQKSNVQFQMKNINAASSKISIVDDTTNDEVDIDVVQSNLSLASLGTRNHGSLSDAPVDAHHPQTHTLGSHSTRAHNELSDAPISAHHVKTSSADIDARIVVQNTHPAGTIDIAIDALILTHKNIATAHQDAPGLISTHTALPNAHHTEVHVLALTGPHSTALPWSDLSKTSSSLADLATRNHGSLSDAPTDAHHTEIHILGTTGPHSGTLPLTDIAGINLLTEKTTLETADVLLIEDSGASYVKKKALIANLIQDVTYGANWDNKFTRSPSSDKLYEKFTSVDTNISALQGAILYKGTWNASTAAYPTPVVTGDYYIVSTAGTTNGIFYEILDWIVYNGSTWDRVRQLKADLTISVSTSESIQTAITTLLTAGGGELFLEPGTHIFTTRATISNTGKHIRIFGAGDSTILQTDASAGVFYVTDINSAILENFKINAVPLGTSNHNMIEVDETNDNPVIIRNVNMIGDGSNGIGVIIKSKDCVVKDCIIDSMNWGIDIWANDNVIVDNIIKNSGGRGISNSGGANVLIISNVVNGSGGYGILSAGVGTTIVGNSVINGTGAVSGMPIATSGANGYQTIVGNTVTGNTINDSSHRGGITINGGSFHVISGNTVTNNSNSHVSGEMYGIQIFSAGIVGVVIGHNQLYGNDDGEIQDNGTDTRIAGDNTVFGSGWAGKLGTPTINAVYDEFNNNRYTKTEVDGLLHAESHSLASHSSKAHSELTGYNDEANVKHLTDAQQSALHTILDGYTKAEINVERMIGSANAKELPMSCQGGELFSEFVMGATGEVRNTGAPDFTLAYLLPNIPTNKYGLKLYVKDVIIGLVDADSGDKPTANLLYGWASYSGPTTVINVGDFTGGTPGEKRFSNGGAWAGPYDMSSYKDVRVGFSVLAANVNDFGMSYVHAEVYYDT